MHRSPSRSRVRGPALLELVEPELIGVAKLEAEALVDDVDDPRELRLLGLVLRPRPEKIAAPKPTWHNLRDAVVAHLIRSGDDVHLRLEARRGTATPGSH